MEAILADFGKRGIRQDPVMHFYETFLAVYDPDIRERRGVYYTPEPVISYIVRSVDHILKDQFGCTEGLGDRSMWDYEALEVVDGEEKAVTKRAHRVLMLDPACGTGSFLYGVIDHIRQDYRNRGRAGMWDSYVREHLLKRIYGFELIPFLCDVTAFSLGSPMDSRFRGNDGGGGATACDLRRSHSELV